MTTRMRDELISVGMGICALTVMALMESFWGLLWGVFGYAVVLAIGQGLGWWNLEPVQPEHAPSEEK